METSRILIPGNRSKRLLALLTAACLTTAGLAPAPARAETEASPVQWRHDLAKAQAEARRTNKPLLVQMTASWCHFCHKMLRETYSDKKLAQEINQHFIPVLVDADQNPGLVAKLKIQVFPYCAVTSADLDEKKGLKGFRSVTKLRNELSPYYQVLAKTSTTSPTTKPQAKVVSNPVIKPTPVAYHGLDLVVARDQRRWKTGRADIRLVHQGLEYRFESTKNAQAFRANIARYLPAQAGRCPVTQDAGQLRYAALFQERLYLCANAQSHQLFLARPENYVATGMSVRSYKKPLVPASATEPALNAAADDSAGYCR